MRIRNENLTKKKDFKIDELINNNNLKAATFK